MANKVRRNRRRQQVNLVTNIIFCLITLAALTGCIILLLQNYGLRNKSQEAMARLKEFEDKEEEYIYTQADMEAYSKEIALKEGELQKAALLDDLKLKMSSGESTSEMLRDFFPEDVVVYSDGKYNFFPISDKLKKHNYVYDNFVVQENNEVVYMDDTQEIKSLKGIDVSK